MRGVANRNPHIHQGARAAFLIHRIRSQPYDDIAWLTQNQRSVNGFKDIGFTSFKGGRWQWRRRQRNDAFLAWCNARQIRFGDDLPASCCHNIRHGFGHTTNICRITVRADRRISVSLNSIGHVRSIARWEGGFPSQLGQLIKDGRTIEIRGNVVKPWFDDSLRAKKYQRAGGESCKQYAPCNSADTQGIPFEKFLQCGERDVIGDHDQQHHEADGPQKLRRRDPFKPIKNHGKPQHCQSPEPAGLAHERHRRDPPRISAPTVLCEC
jgi:hypothetical protein